MCPFTSQKCPFIPRITLLFSRITFLFSNLPFCFLELPFCFQEAPFYFSKILYCFSELPLSFSEVPSFYLLYSYFLKNAFFLWCCIFTLPCSKLLRDAIIPLLLSCFLFQLYLFTYLLNLSSVSFTLGRKTKSTFKLISNEVIQSY